jgi:hypothetical protein
MKKCVVLFILISSFSFSQNVNDYQYIFVPAKFSIFKEKDKFRLNTNVKLLLQKYGFKSYFVSDSVPNEIVNTNCSKLYAELENDNSFFNTKVKIILRDCNEKIVFQTEFGSSREKELVIAYNQALREAGKSFDKLNYRYNGKNGGVTETVSVIKQAENETPQTNLSSTTTASESFYFAQPIPNGFQVIDNEPKVIMRFYSTSQKDVFIAIRGNTNGIVFNKEGQWFFEYYLNSKLVSEPLKLKF